MKRVLLMIVLALVLPESLWSAPAGSPEEVFFRANRSFKEARYQDAARDYGRLIESGNAGGHVYYNLADAFYKMNSHGKAILNYERARLLIPRDADLAFNLSHALEKRTDATAPPRQPLSSALFWLGSLSLAELFLIFASFNIALFAVLLLRVFVKKDWNYYLLMVLLFAWGFSGISFGLKYYEIVTDSRGVVISRQADVLAGPEAGDTVLFRLHEGTIVLQDRFESGWRLISLADGKRGWVRNKDVESIVDVRLRPKIW